MKMNRKWMAVMGICAAMCMGTAAGAEGTSDKELVIGSMQDTISMTPWGNNSTYDYYMMNAVYDKILYSDGTYAELDPRVAESYELSEDGLTLTLKIREGITFHDGSSLTAEDVAFSINQYISSPYYMETMGYITSAEATDDMTVVITAGSYSPSFLWDIGDCFVICKAAYEADSEGYLADPIGCGPYRIVSKESGSSTVLEAFSDYYRGEAAIKNVTIDIIPDSTTLELGLKDGSIDYAKIASSSIANLENAEDLVLDYAPSDIFYELFFNCENEYLQDPAVRKSIAYAINTSVIANNLLFGAADVNSFVPLSENCYEWNIESAGEGSYDVEKAKQLLADAGYPDGIDLGTIKCRSDATQEKIITVIQNNLQEAGIHVELDVVDANTSITDLLGGNYDLELMCLSYYDSVFAAAGCYDEAAIGSANFARFYTDELTELFDQGLTTADEAERQEIADQILSYMNENLPSMKLCDNKLAIVYDSDLNVTLRTDDWLQIYDLSWNE